MNFRLFCQKKIANFDCLIEKNSFSSVQSFFISATCRTKYLHQRNYTTEKGTGNKTKQRCNMQKLNKLH